MRYKKGSKVEVLSRNEVPSGAWRCAKIVCGNGHNYNVRYERCPGAFDEAIVERVSRNTIRPCPPPMELSESWVPGDVVEVFHNLAWKMATVVKDLSRNCFVVRLVGSSQEFKVSKFDLRARQSWQNDEWIMIGKGCGSGEDGKRNERSTLKYNKNLGFQVKTMDAKTNLLITDDCFAAWDNMNFQESHIDSSGTLKRAAPYCYSQAEAHEGTAHKFIVTEKEGRCHRVVAANPSLPPEKADAVASTREMLGKKLIHASLDKMDMERQKLSGAVGCSCAMSLERDNADNVTCSVGSCSITSFTPYKSSWLFSAGPVEDTEGHFSDAESFCHYGYEEGNCLLPSSVELAAEIHRLELHAYRCTMEALHASGPLSWEQETLVTNLRILLHISNDEHLTELRNLVSTATSIPIS